MKKIYLDSDFKCHLSDDGTMTAVETDAFDGKCDGYIIGTRFVPIGKAWTRSDGVVFHGEMVSLWNPYSALAAQAQYEADMAALNAAYREGVNSV